MPLHVLNPLLASQGLAMPNLGDIDVQTISGATSTGTHGTGANLTGLAAQIAGLEIVLADGSVVTCSASERPELFCGRPGGPGGARRAVDDHPADRAGVHRSAPSRGRRGCPRSSRASMHEAESNDHFEFYWFPHTDRVLTKRNNRVAEGESLKPLSRVKGWVDDELLSNKVFSLGQQADPAGARHHPARQRDRRPGAVAARVHRAVLRGVLLQPAGAVRGDGIRRAQRASVGDVDPRDRRLHPLLGAARSEDQLPDRGQGRRSGRRAPLDRV